MGMKIKSLTEEFVDIFTLRAVSTVTEEAVAVVVDTEDLTILIAVPVTGAGVAAIRIADRGLGQDAVILISGSEDLISLQTCSGGEGPGHGAEDGVGGFPVQAQEVIRVHLPDEGALDSCDSFYDSCDNLKFKNTNQQIVF